jgi:hypothetical protein
MTGYHSKERNRGKYPDFYVGSSQEKIVNPEDPHVEATCNLHPPFPESYSNNQGPYHLSVLEV